MISIAKVAAFCGAMLIGASASADVMYRWVGDPANQGYGRNLQMELVLSDLNSYAGQSPGCLFYSSHPCDLQPDIDLVSFSFGIGGPFMKLEPRTNRYGGTGWDISVDGIDGKLVGTLLAFDWSNSIQMSSIGDIWTVSNYGSDHGNVIEDDTITGTFERVPEPATIYLTIVALAGGILARRRQRLR